jgi:response regulator RpfG family c-di-GMP phosphodiesterase
MDPRKFLKKINVLAVDDQPGHLVALEAVLSDDYSMITASSGKQAIEIVSSRNDIHVILMDILMPEMDGFEAATQIKQIRGCEEIPIIFITAVYKEDPFIRKGYQIGAVDYFSKPFDPEILKMKVAIYGSFRQKADFLKERETQIRETEELIKAGRKLSAILETLPVGVLIADGEGRIFQTNDETSRICRAIEPTSDNYGKILGWWDSAGHMLKQGPLVRALKHQETSHNEFLRMQCFDGTYKTILASASPLIGTDGKVVGAVVIIKDITESKKIEEDLEQRITKLVALGVEFEHTAKH